MWTNPKDGMEFVFIPAGSFTAEIPEEQSDTGYTQQNITFFQGFLMGRTEVTVAQFRRFVRETGYITDAEKDSNDYTWRSPGFAQQDNHPVVYLSYRDAHSYTQWAGVDLPTEAEWLFACRAGTTTRYYWGDSLDDRYVWHRANTEGTGTRAVAGKLPNAWGLYDMVGNAWEYTIVCPTSHVQLGGSWTRCPEYLTRQGFVAKDLLAGTVKPRLHKCEPNRGYPWDDDRGFRCLKRGQP